MNSELDLGQLKVAELKAVLRGSGLSTRGTKAILKARIEEHQTSLTSHGFARKRKLEVEH